MEAVDILAPEANKVAQLAAYHLIDTYRSEGTLTKREEDFISRATSFGAGAISAWIMAHYLMPSRARARFMFIALIICTLLLLSLGTYCWFAIGFTYFKAFWVFWIPSLIGIMISTLKAFKMWSEARKYLAEARKAEAEANEIIGR